MLASVLTGFGLSPDAAGLLQEMYEGIAKGRVARVAKTGGEPEILATNLQQPSSLVVDATSVYVSVENTGATGTIVTLAK